MTSWPLVRRTLATLRKAEFGFFGVRVMTCTQTPRRCGAPLSAGGFVLTTTLRRPLRTSWLIVGIPGFLWGFLNLKIRFRVVRRTWAHRVSKTKTRHRWRAKLLKLAWRTMGLPPTVTRFLITQDRPSALSDLNSLPRFAR